MKITHRQLEIFIAIAQMENVSRAAERLCMSQSAASQALVELERAFSCQLFDRLGKSLKLNALGRGLLPLAQSSLRHLQQIEGYLSGEQIGPLRLAASMTIGNYLATTLVAEQMSAYPEAKIELFVANTDAIIGKLLGLDCDLGLIEGEVTHPDLLIEPWMEDELVVFCAPEHPLADGSAAGNALLASQQWILRERGSGTRSQFDRLIGAALDAVNIRMELAHTEAIKRAVESKLGVSCLSRISLREAFRRGSLVEIPTPQFDLRRRFSFARHRLQYETASVTSFMNLCRRYPTA